MNPKIFIVVWIVCAFCGRSQGNWIRRAYDDDETEEIGKNDSINYILIFANADDNEIDAKRLFKCPTFQSNILPCTKNYEDTISKPIIRHVLPSNRPCNCNELLKYSLMSLLSWAQNVMDMNTATIKFQSFKLSRIHQRKIRSYHFIPRSEMEHKEDFIQLPLNPEEIVTPVNSPELKLIKSNPISMFDAFPPERRFNNIRRYNTEEKGHFFKHRINSGKQVEPEEKIVEITPTTNEFFKKTEGIIEMTPLPNVEMNQDETKHLNQKVTKDRNKFLQSENIEETSTRKFLINGKKNCSMFYPIEKENFLKGSAELKSTTEEITVLPAKKINPQLKDVQEEIEIVTHENEKALKGKEEHHEINEQGADNEKMDLFEMLNMMAHSVKNPFYENESNLGASLYEMAIEMFEKLKNVKSKNGFIAVIHGGTFSDLKNSTTDLIKTLQYIAKNFEYEKTVLVLAGDCPKNYPQKDSEKLPLIVTGPNFDVFQNARELYDLPVIVKFHIETSCRGTSCTENVSPDNLGIDKKNEMSLAKDLIESQYEWNEEDTKSNSKVKRSVSIVSNSAQNRFLLKLVMSFICFVIFWTVF